MALLFNLPFFAVRLLPLYFSLVSAATRDQYIQNARETINVMNRNWYNTTTGQWSNAWWQTANILTTIADFADIDRSYRQEAADLLYHSFYAARADNDGSFLNNFYDDEGWWALAWIKAYDLTGDIGYMYAAQEIFEDMMTGMGATCGGIWWSKERANNNAISNELFLSVAAALANRGGPYPRPDYRSIAMKQAAWLLSSGMRTENRTYHDGLTLPDCQGKGTVWSYNQGVILGGLVELWKATDDRSYLAAAHDIAQGAINTLTDENGILTDFSRFPRSDPTAAQFKGVFARNLGILYRAQSSDDFAAFLRSNADSIWSAARTTDGRLGSNWQGPVADLIAPSQGSALDCIVAAAQVS